MSKFNKNGAPVVFINNNYVGLPVSKDHLSLRDKKKLSKKESVAIVEIKGEIKLKRGICATAIIIKAKNGEYKHTLHWPELNEHGEIAVRKNGHDPNCIAVISDMRGNLHIKKGEEAKAILAGWSLEAGLELEFIPPVKLKQLKKLV